MGVDGAPDALLVAAVAVAYVAAASYYLALKSPSETGVMHE